MTNPSTSEISPAAPEAVMPLITGHWVAAIVRTHVALGVPELLRNGPQSALAIAAATEADPDATHRLLRAGVAVGLLTHDSDGGTFAQTSLLAALRPDSPGSLADLALLWTTWSEWAPWGRFTEAVRTGHDQMTETVGMRSWEYFAAHPELADLFGRAVTAISAPVIAAAVAQIDIGDARTVVDVGGANGDFVLRLLDRHRSLHGIVFDLPTALNGPRAAVARAQLVDRCEIVGGSFFDTVPTADIYLLKYILHDWDDDSCVRILRSCAAAMRPGGRVLVVDAVLGEPSDPGAEAALMDMNMLAHLPGREHDLADFDDLFAAAGLRRSGLTPLLGAQHLIEALADSPDGD